MLSLLLLLLLWYFITVKLVQVATYIHKIEIFLLLLLLLCCLTRLLFT